MISIIIPARNAGGTIGETLSSIRTDHTDQIEVIVVDDGSTDGTAETAGPVLSGLKGRLIRLEGREGAGRARNRGAEAAMGEILLFTDADCVFRPGLVAMIENEAGTLRPGTILGGTYTPLSSDRGLFSDFQSVFINYSETRHPESPDYIPTHLMIMRREDFLELGGFREDFLPILEDVEFSHRAREKGFRLRMIPSLQVGHLFNYTFLKSLKNAFRKSFYWAIYSIHRGDLLRDSGTASRELKINLLSWSVTLLLLSLTLFLDNMTPLLFSIPANILNIVLNKGLLSAFFRAGGPGFGTGASIYYLGLYPLPVLSGGVLGAILAPLFRKRVEG